MKFEIILRTQKTLSDGTHPIMLKFTNKGERKFKMSEKGFAISEADWNKDARRPIQVRKSHPKYELYKKIRVKLNDLDSAYTKEIDKLEEKGRRMTIDQLIQRVENPIDNITVFNYFDRVINQTKGNNLGHSKTFVTCKQRISEFTKSKDLEFHTINLRWLNDWRDYMKARSEIADATLSIYFRTLRTVFNRAIGEGYCDKRDYPFGKKSDKSKFNISQFRVKANKRAISQDETLMIKNLDLSDVSEIKRRDKNGKAIRSIYREDLETAQMMFMFSYYAAGMNYNDIARLTWKDVDLNEGVITYVRTKTGKELLVYIHPYIMEILTVRDLITGDNDDNYVFDVLHRAVHRNEKKIRGRIHRQMRLVNDALKEIQKMTGIKTDLTTYVARHSVITHMLEKGTRPDVVQMIVGHSDLATTMGYHKGASKKDRIQAVNSLD